MREPTLRFLLCLVATVVAGCAASPAPPGFSGLEAIPADDFEGLSVPDLSAARPAAVDETTPLLLVQASFVRGAPGLHERLGLGEDTPQRVIAAGEGAPAEELEAPAAQWLFLPNVIAWSGQAALALSRSQHTFRRGWTTRSVDGTPVEPKADLGRFETGGLVALRAEAVADGVAVRSLQAETARLLGMADVRAVLPSGAGARPVAWSEPVVALAGASMDDPATLGPDEALLVRLENAVHRATPALRTELEDAPAAERWRPASPAAATAEGAQWLAAQETVLVLRVLRAAEAASRQGPIRSDAGSE